MESGGQEARSAHPWAHPDLGWRGGVASRLSGGKGSGAPPNTISAGDGSGIRGFGLAYQNGVVVSAISIEGLVADASFGGQDFSFQPKE